MITLRWNFACVAFHFTEKTHLSCEIFLRLFSSSPWNYSIFNRREKENFSFFSAIFLRWKTFLTAAFLLPKWIFFSLWTFLLSSLNTLIINPDYLSFFVASREKCTENCKRRKKINLDFHWIFHWKKKNSLFSAISLFSDLDSSGFFALDIPSRLDDRLK